MGQEKEKKPEGLGERKQTYMGPLRRAEETCISVAKAFV